MDYRLDLRTLLLMLGRSTGSLDADLLHVQGIRGSAHVLCRLESGRIQSCSITDANGTIRYTDKVAFKLVQDLVLEWHCTDEPELSAFSLREASPRRQLVPASPIPRRTDSAIPHNFNSWPRPYRTVYSLINGVSSVDQIIKTVAHGEDPSGVIEVIAQLQQAGLITFRDV